MRTSHSKCGKPSVTTHLFDTNAWIRQVVQPEQLNRATLELLASPGITPLAVSAISVWEIALKDRKGKLDLGLPVDQWFKSVLRPSVIIVLPIDAAIAREANRLPGFAHEDPADRIVVATARVHDLTILTSDEKILAYPHVRSLDTR